MLASGWAIDHLVTDKQQAPRMRTFTSRAKRKETLAISRRRLIATSALTVFGAPRACTRTALRTRFARFTGDFEAMLDLRHIRFVVPYSRTLFFQDKGAVYGTAAYRETPGVRK
jgi:hypothetical protein